METTIKIILLIAMGIISVWLYVTAVMKWHGKVTLLDRFLCWKQGHLWEFDGISGGSDYNGIQSVYVCKRCDTAEYRSEVESMEVFSDADLK